MMVYRPKSHLKSDKELLLDVMSDPVPGKDGALVMLDDREAVIDGRLIEPDEFDSGRLELVTPGEADVVFA